MNQYFKDSIFQYSQEKFNNLNRSVFFKEIE